MLYIGTHLGGLSRYDINKGVFYNYMTDNKFSNFRNYATNKPK